MSISGDKLVLSDGAREVDFLFLGWGHTPGDGYVWLPAERVLATGDAAVNGPRNKLLDAYLANWPKALDKAIALAPEHVLPGHGDAGGIEILKGQQQFLIDLYAAVKAQADAGKKPAEMKIELPKPDQWWFPDARARPAPAGHRDGVSGDHIARARRLDPARVEMTEAKRAGTGREPHAVAMGVHRACDCGRAGSAAIRSRRFLGDAFADAGRRRA